MKILLLFLTIIMIGNTEDVRVDVQVYNKLNSNAIILQLFDMLKYYIKHGNSAKDVPILDPTYFDNTDIEFTSSASILSLHAGFSNGVLRGLGGYQLLQAEFIKNEVVIDLCLNFPDIIIKSGHYELNGNIYDSLPINGMGRLDLEILNFTFCGKTYLKQSVNGKSILIKNITNPIFNIQQIISRTEIDGNIDDIVNAIIKDLLAAYLNRFNKFIAKMYIDRTIEIMNLFLNKFESWRIIATLL